MKAFLAKLRFLLAYSAAFSEKNDHAKAIHAGLTRLARKPPFNVLTADDIKRIVPVWALMPSPQAVVAMVVNVVKQNDATPLKDRWILEQLARKWKAINKKRGP